MSTTTASRPTADAAPSRFDALAEIIAAVLLAGLVAWVWWAWHGSNARMDRVVAGLNHELRDHGEARTKALDVSYSCLTRAGTGWLSKEMSAQQAREQARTCAVADGLYLQIVALDADNRRTWATESQQAGWDFGWELGCVVKRRRLSVGANPTRQLMLRPVATGDVGEVTNRRKPLV